MSEKVKVHNQGIGLCGILTVIFVVLKLIGEHFHTPVADWSWWLIFGPVWMPLAVVLFVIVFCLLMHVIVKRLR